MSYHIRSLFRSALMVGLFVLSGGVFAGVAAQQSIRGVVVDPDGGALPSVRIELEGRSVDAVTGADGRFQLGPLRPGRYRVTATLLGYRAATRPVVLGADADGLRLVLVPRPIELKSVTVIGTRSDLAEVKERMRQVPGSVALIEREELESTRLANFHDVLRYTPGVFVQPRFGAADESQISIRGSGLRNNFHLRGLNILVNGMPYRNADGFTDFESLELSTTEDIQVYKGANALRYGAPPSAAP